MSGETRRPPATLSESVRVGRNAAEGRERWGILGTGSKGGESRGGLKEADRPGWKGRGKSSGGASVSVVEARAFQKDQHQSDLVFSAVTFAFLLHRTENQDASASRPGRTGRVDLLGGKKSYLSHFLWLMDGRLVEGGKVRLIKEGGPFGGTKAEVHWLLTGRTHAKCSCWSRSLRKKGKKSACMSNHLAQTTAR